MRRAAQYENIAAMGNEDGASFCNCAGKLRILFAGSDFLERLFSLCAFIFVTIIRFRATVGVENL